MNAEIRREAVPQEIELPNACAVCGGPIAARFTKEGARGVCLACHLVTTIMILRQDDEVRLAHVPGGIA